MDKNINCTQILPLWNLESVTGYMKGYRGNKIKLGSYFKKDISPLFQRLSNLKCPSLI